MPNLRCPKCGSYNISYGHFDFVKYQEPPVLGEPNIVTVICFDCRHEGKYHLGIYSPGLNRNRYMKFFGEGEKDVNGVGIYLRHPRNRVK